MPLSYPSSAVDVLWGLEPATSYIFRLTRNEERGPVLTAETHQAPESLCSHAPKESADLEHAPNTCTQKEGSGSVSGAVLRQVRVAHRDDRRLPFLSKHTEECFCGETGRPPRARQADAVALLAKNYLFMLLSDEHKAKSVTRDAAARYEQRIWRDRMRRRLDWHNRTALKIQVACTCGFRVYECNTSEMSTTRFAKNERSQ